MLDYNQFMKESAAFDKLAQECEDLKNKIDAELEDYDTAMHVMFFDDPPLEYLRDHVNRLAVLCGEFSERVERLHAYNIMWELEK